MITGRAAAENPELTLIRENGPWRMWKKWQPTIHSECGEIEKENSAFLFYSQVKSLFF